MDETRDDLIKRVLKTRRRCAEDINFFISNFCFTIDTRKSNAIFLMKLWEHQKKLLKQLLKYEHLIIEKSRDMGISWTIMAFELHQCLFTEGFTCLNISRKESEVEDSGKTFHSLMGRLKFMYDHLPDFLKLKMQNPFLTFKIPSNNSVIRGESANPDAGRDTQYKFIFIDEAAFINCLDKMWSGVSNAGKAICLNSTPPHDADNKFVHLRQMKNSGFKLLKFHWSEHPEKDAAWYANKIKTMTVEEVARELDMNYERAKETRVYSEFTSAEHVSTYTYYYNENHPLILGFDFGLEGEAVGFYQKDANDRLFKLWQYEERDLLTYQHVINIDKILGKLKFHGKHTDLLCFGDPSGNRRGRATKESVIAEYNRCGFNIKFRRVSFEEKRRTVKAVLRNKIKDKPKFSMSKPTDENKLGDFVNAMVNARLNKDFTDQVDDWTTHKVNEFEYVLINLFPLIRATGIIVNIDKPHERENVLNDFRSSRPASILKQPTYQRRRSLIFR